MGILNPEKESRYKIHQIKKTLEPINYLIKRESLDPVSKTGKSDKKTTIKI